MNDSTDPKQNNSCAAVDGSAVNQSQISYMSAQAANNIPLNVYTNQPMNISSISPHQQMGVMQPQHMPNPQQMQPQNYMQLPMHMQQHALSTQNQRMPGLFNYNGRMQPQQQMMAQRPGLGHQQVYWLPGPRI